MAVTWSKARHIARRDCKAHRQAVAADWCARRDTAPAFSVANQRQNHALLKPCATALHSGPATSPVQALLPHHLFQQRCCLCGSATRLNRANCRPSGGALPMWRPVLVIALSLLAAQRRPDEMPGSCPPPATAEGRDCRYRPCQEAAARLPAIHFAERLCPWCTARCDQRWHWIPWRSPAGLRGPTPSNPVAQNGASRGASRSVRPPATHAVEYRTRTSSPCRVRSGHRSCRP